jgi:hypothetical protein
VNLSRRTPSAISHKILSVGSRHKPFLDSQPPARKRDGRTLSLLIKLEAQALPHLSGVLSMGHFLRIPGPKSLSPLCTSSLQMKWPLSQVLPPPLHFWSSHKRHMYAEA